MPAQKVRLWCTGTRCWAAAGLRLVERADFDPLAADVGPDVRVVSEECAETAAVEGLRRV